MISTTFQRGTIRASVRASLHQATGQEVSLAETPIHRHQYAVAPRMVVWEGSMTRPALVANTMYKHYSSLSTLSSTTTTRRKQRDPVDSLTEPTMARRDGGPCRARCKTIGRNGQSSNRSSDRRTDTISSDVKHIARAASIVL